MRECFDPTVYKADWQYQEGDLTVTRTCQWSAPGCHQGCSLLFYTDKDGKLVKVEGDPRSPVTDGRLCMRCLAMVEAVYHPERIIHPLIRVGEKGENKWKQITMDEAYDTVIKWVEEITEKWGAHAIATGAGTGRNATWQANVLGKGGFKSPNDSAGLLAGNCCYTPRMNAMNAFMGSTFIADCGQLNEGRFDHPEYRRPDLMIVWGNNPLRANADGFFGHWVIDCMQRGMKLFVVDPQVTWLSAHAEKYIQLRPGTDGALGMALCNVMIQEDLYDHEFVENWCYGFDEFAERVATMPPEKAAEICWCDAEDIYEAARLIGTAGVTTLQWGVAIDHTKWANGTSHSIMALQALTGNIDVPGGFVAIDFGWVQADIRDNVAKMFPDLGEDALGHDIKWGAFNAIGKAGHCMPEALLDAVEREDPYPLKMLFLCSTNTFVNIAGDARRVYNAYKKMEKVVVCDLFMTPTAVAFGDLFIPMAMSCERNGVRGWYTPLRSIVKCVQTGEAVGDEQMMLEIGKKMNPDLFYWDDVPEMLEFCVNNMSSVPITFTLDELREKVIIYPEFKYNKFRNGTLRFDGQIGFNTISGRCELFCNMYNNIGIDPLPYYKEPPESPVSTPELFEKYPLVCSTGRRSWEFFHSEYRQMKSMREFHPYPMFDINPKDAEKYGIREGDWCLIENPHGEGKWMAHLTPTMLEGVVNVEHGWWFPEQEGAEPNLYGAWQSNAGCLTVQGDFGPSGYGSSYKTQLCRITPCENPMPYEPYPEGCY